MPRGGSRSDQNLNCRDLIYTLECISSPAEDASVEPRPSGRGATEKSHKYRVIVTCCLDTTFVDLPNSVDDENEKTKERTITLPLSEIRIALSGDGMITKMESPNLRITEVPD